MAKRNKYEVLASSVIELVGGKENISLFTHCVTRLRFNVKDRSIVKKEEIEKIEGVIGGQWSGEQLQIIIGNGVGQAYETICAKNNLEQSESVNENLDSKSKKKFSVNMVFDAISGCITPLIPVMIGAGFIKIILILGEVSGLLVTGNSTHTFLTILGDAGFYFLPILVGASSAKKFGANMYLGMLIGAVFVHPGLASAFTEGKSMTIFGIPVYSTSYLYSIFPVILTVFVMAPIQRFFGKYSPASLRTITEPLLTLIVILPIALCVLGPIGSFLGVYLAEAIMWFYDTTGFLGIATLSAIMPWLVMTGMHTAFGAYTLTAFTTMGKEPIMMIVTIVSNIGQGAACLGVALKTRDKSLRSTALSCAITAIVGGVTEPALFGINLRLKTPMYGAMIGSFIGGAIAGIGNVYAYTLPGSGGLFMLPSFISSDMSNLIWICIAVLISLIVTFIATYILYHDKDVVA